MTPFHSAREAKEFLISKIVEEAQRDHIVLSETERKMLYFSETDWTLPDMDKVSDEFDKAYNQSDYEKRIARLIRNAGKHAKESPTDYDAWWDAIRVLEAEDHYVLVMIRQAGLRPRGDLFKLWATGFAVTVAIIACIFLSIFLSDRYGINFGKYVPSRDALGLYVWMTAFFGVIAYQFLRFFLGSKKVDDRVFGLIIRWVRKREHLASPRIEAGARANIR